MAAKRKTYVFRLLRLYATWDNERERWNNFVTLRDWDDDVNIDFTFTTKDEVRDIGSLSVRTILTDQG